MVIVPEFFTVSTATGFTLFGVAAMTTMVWYWLVSSGAIDRYTG